MNLRAFASIFFYKSALILTAFFLYSCTSDKDLSVNKTFNDKYAKDVERVKAERAPPKEEFPKQRLEFTASIEPDFRYANNNLGADLEQYSNFEGANSQVILRNSNAYDQNPQNPALKFSTGIFDNSYRAAIDVPLRKIGAEFDAINVPPQDAYGIKTEISQKEYLLPSAKLLQKNIDQINNNKSPDDVEDSELLIAEQRNLKRKKKMIKIFGEDAIELEDEKNKKLLKKSDKTRQDSKKSETDRKKSDTSLQPLKAPQNTSAAPTTLEVKQ
jgi:hypothetical protein